MASSFIYMKFSIEAVLSCIILEHLDAHHHSGLEILLTAQAL